MSELREFVYINDVSVNSHLSSLGRGVPQEIIQTEGEEFEKGGEAGAKVFDIGGKGSVLSLDSSGMEKTLSITEPYRFEDFLNALEDEEIEIHENPDPRSLARGDVVRIEGEVVPMSLFKFETALNAMKKLFNMEVKESMDQLDEETPEELNELAISQLDAFRGLLEKFTGDTIPMRIETDDWYYGVPLDRDKMRVPPANTFVEKREFTLIGRVDERLISDDTWDPIMATNVMDQYFPGEDGPQEMREQLEAASEEVNMDIGEQDWQLSGHSAIIHPLAMFW